MHPEHEPIADEIANERENRQLKNDLLYAIRENNEDRLAELCDVYAERYPDEAPLVELLVRVHDYVENNIRAAGTRLMKDPEERLHVFEALTSFHIDLTSFIAKNADNEELVTALWNSLEETVDEPEDKEQIRRMRKGILTQVAVQKIFEAAGGDPHLSSPEEDARHAIDLWLDDTTAVQVKGVSGCVAQLITRTDTIAFPATISGNSYVNSELMHELSRFKLKIEAYGKSIEKDLTGILIAVPYHEINQTTGKPSEELIARVRRELETMGQGD